jgi:hypothetical protein
MAAALMAAALMAAHQFRPTDKEMVAKDSMAYNLCFLKVKSLAALVVFAVSAGSSTAK